MFFSSLVIILLVIGFFVQRSQIGNLRVDISSLRKQLGYLESRLFEIDAGSSAKIEKKPTVTPKVEQKKVEEPVKSGAFYKGTKHTNDTEDSNRNIVSHSYVPQTKALNADWGEKVKSTFEQNIATKLPVWIGAISLIFAAFFLVKYSVELGWLSPSVRISLGALFGLALLGFGQWLGKKEDVTNSLRMGQGLIGAGLVALYVCIYASIHLYGLIAPIMGFGAMTGVTALAVLLSLRFGQPIAVFGLVGGLLTPALVGSDEPNALALFTYLFLLFSALLAVLVRKGWWLLAILALVGVFAWSVFWFLLVFSVQDALILELFSMAVAGAVLVITGKKVMQDTISEEEKWSVHGLNFLAIAGGVLTILWLGFETTITLFDWSMLGLLSVGLIALTCYQPMIYQRPLFLKLGASLCMLFLWAHHATLAKAIAVIVGLSVIYVVGSGFILRRVSDPRFWALLQAITAIALYVIAYFTMDIPIEFMNSFGMLWGTLALVLASLCVYQAYEIVSKYKADKDIKDRLLAIYTLAASAFIAIGFTIVLPWAQAPLAIAGQIAATAWVFHKTKISFLKIIMMILTIVFAVMNYDQIVLFAGLITSSLLGESLSYYTAQRHTLDMPYLAFGVPIGFIGFALFKMWQTDQEDKKIMHVLFGALFLLVMACGYYGIRDAFDIGVSIDFINASGFIERAVITILMAGVAIGLLKVLPKYNLSFLVMWGVALFHLAMLRFAYFDLILLNPYWSGAQLVGSLPLLNGVTLTYGAALLFSIWAVFKGGFLRGRDRKLYGYLGLAFLFSLVTLNVRQFYHGGNIIEGYVGASELYTYSVVWLLTGLAMLTTGIRWDHKAARMVSIAFVTLAILKVFLIDAAELEGLYRVFSFLGLGVSLIGLSYFYSKFVFTGSKASGK